MKTTRITKQSAILVAVLTAATAYGAPADQTAPVAQNEKSYTGTLVALSPQEHTLTAKSWWLTKNFSLGDNCTYAIVGRSNNGLAADLQPGDVVTIRYQLLNGVRVADGVKEQADHVSGSIRAVDPENHSLTLQLSAANRTLQIADNCHIALLNNQTATLADLQPGEYVTVTYDTPDKTPTARQITQSGMEFTGRVTGIDLDTKRVTARTMFDTRKFDLAKNCAIMMPDNKTGNLSDLKLNERFTFSYNDINGVNVANRIQPAPPESQSSSVVINSSAQGGY